MIFKCKECGEEVNSDAITSGNEYAEKQLCVTCDQFTNILNEFETDSYVVIDKVCYHVSTASRTISDRGFSGRVFKIRLKASSFIFETDNLWCCGDVPKHFQDRLPDTAKFIKGI